MTVDERLAEIRRLVELGQYAEAYEHRGELVPLFDRLTDRQLRILVVVRQEFVDFDMYCDKMTDLRNALLQ